MDQQKISFEAVDEPPGIAVLDRIEQLQYQLFTPTAVSPAPIDGDSFRYPADRGIRVETDQITTGSNVVVMVRDESGAFLTCVEHLEEESFPEGRYIIEVNAPIKTYLEVEGPLRIERDMLETRYLFDQPTGVDIGLLSQHTRPVASITTTRDPVDMMAAISAFGTALKTTSPERSFPLYRGHPPQVEFGGSLDIPDTLERPDTGIRIEVPPRYDMLYPVSTLAYYLGATLAPGQRPQLVTDNGFEFGFDHPDGFESAVERTLKQVFLLDCVTRTEGKNKLDMEERRTLDGRVDLDWAALYSASPGERLERYLSVPHELIEPSLPEWRLAVHADPVAETVTQLPFVVADLAVVRTADSRPTVTAATGAGATDALTRSTADTTAQREFVEPTQTDSLEQAWIGDKVPIGASKLVPEAFQNRLDRAVDEEDISLTIVVNDSRMTEECDLVNKAYGDRSVTPFDISVRSNLSVAELRRTLHEDCSFLHYIGHINDSGFECADGRLDATRLDRTGVDAFLLNACNSYEQGLSLVRAGAVGGIVTLADIVNHRAVDMGETIARLLNTGFPLRSALTIAREASILGGQYIVVGDGGMTVSQPKSQTAVLPEVTPCDDGYSVEIETFATDTAALGTLYTPHIGDNDRFFLSSGTIGPFHVSEAELAEFLSLENMPVRVGSDGLCWSSDIDLSTLN